MRTASVTEKFKMCQLNQHYSIVGKRGGLLSSYCNRCVLRIDAPSSHHLMHHLGQGAYGSVLPQILVPKAFSRGKSWWDDSHSPTSILS